MTSVPCEENIHIKKIKYECNIYKVKNLSVFLCKDPNEITYILVVLINFFLKKV
jgi:hypothetical protein